MDLIERQKAIDAHYEYCNKHPDAGFPVWSLKILEDLPSAQPEPPTDDCISRKAAITLPVMPKEHREYQTINLDDAYEQGWNDLQKCIESLPSAQPTLYGYNIEHLELIARVLQKEDLSPERVVEILTDIGRIVAIVRDEFEETLRKAVEQCMT